MEYLDTPKERFDNLIDFPFGENYVEVGHGMKMHYLDEGPSDATETILLLHGEPSWCYLYRYMIPPLVEAGYRCIAPDLIGFGKSSKPTQQSDYTYARHLDWLDTCLQSLQLKNITLFCQDWGGLLGLRLVAKYPEQYARVVASNTGLPTGDQEMPEAFLKWQAFSQKVETFPFEFIIQGATTTELSDEILAGYRAPYPDESFTAGAKIYPALVPTTTDDPETQNNRDAWAHGLCKYNKPFLTLFGDKDPVTKGGELIMQKLIPGCQGQPHTKIENGGHFIQEDKGPELAKHMIAFINSNPLA